MADKTPEEIIRLKVRYAIEALEKRQKHAEDEKKRMAVHLAERYKDDDEQSEKLREQYYLNFWMMKTEAEAFAAAINQIRVSL